MTLPPPPGMWRRAWVNGVDELWSFVEPLRIMQNQGTGLLIQGTREWRDYEVSADVTPHLAQSAGVAARVQGMRRYYALALSRENRLQLLRVENETTVLAEANYEWQLGSTYQLSLSVNGNKLVGRAGDTEISAEDDRLDCGAIALLINEGRTATQVVSVSPVS